MSVKLIDKAFNTDVKGNEKLVLLALADNSNDTGVCFPSYNTLQRKTSMNRGTLAKWIKSLEAKRLIFKANRKRKSGANSSNKYLLFPDEMFELLDEEDALFFNQSLENVLPNQSLEVELPNDNQSLEVELEQSLEVELESEPSLLEPSLSSLTVTQKAELFELFWSVYPKRKAKQKAREAFMKPKNFDSMPSIEIMIDKINMLRATKEWQKDKGQFIPHPATWLNAHGWEDEVNLTETQKISAVMSEGNISALEILEQSGVNT